MIDLKAIEERCDRATKGPWRKSVAGIEGDNYIAGTGPWYRLGNADNEEAIFDADFIAHSREDLPALIEAVKEAIPIMAALTAMCKERGVVNRCPEMAEKWLANIGGE
jgi:hypothetical protein